jgi:hypothetical protein
MRTTVEDLVLIATLKQAVKDDATRLRAEKRAVRAQQRALAAEAPAAQRQLAQHRLEARARLLIYGLLRGRAWEVIEPNHAEPTWSLAWAIKRVWQAAQEAEAAGPSAPAPLPERVVAALPAIWRRSLTGT